MESRKKKQGHVTTMGNPVYVAERHRPSPPPPRRRLDDRRARQVCEGVFAFVPASVRWPVVTDCEETLSRQVCVVAFSYPTDFVAHAPLGMVLAVGQLLQWCAMEASDGRHIRDGATVRGDPHELVDGRVVSLYLVASRLEGDSLRGIQALTGSPRSHVRLTPVANDVVPLNWADWGCQYRGEAALRDMLRFLSSSGIRREGALFAIKEFFRA